MSTEPFTARPSAPSIKSAMTSPRVSYFIDGSNVAKWAEPCSLWPVLTIMVHILRQEQSIFCYFDANFRYVIESQDEVSLFDTLVTRHRSLFCVVTGGSEADEFILPDAESNEGQIFTTDLYRKYRTEYPWLSVKGSNRLLKGRVVRGQLSVPRIKLLSSQRDVRDLSNELNDLLTPSSSKPPERKGTEMKTILASESGEDYSIEARLVVFVLDASGSMWLEKDGACNTYDGETKSSHLSEILRASANRLAVSNVAESFYVALVNFAGEAQVIPIDGAAMVHISHALPFINDKKFSYLDGATGQGTNLTKALSVALEVVDNALNDGASQELHRRWHALIILVTDGHDTVDEEAVYDVAGRMAVQRAALETKRVRLACVAIGNNCNVPLLTSIASEADDRVLGPLRKAGLADYLKKETDALQPSLAIHVDAQDTNYKEVIRLFVDVLSTRSQTT